MHSTQVRSECAMSINCTHCFTMEVNFSNDQSVRYKGDTWISKDSRIPGVQGV